MKMDLTLDSQLKAVLKDIQPFELNKGCLSRLSKFLDYVKNADLETRKTREFHQELWEENRVSGVGMGTVNIAAALDDASFRSWVAEESVKPFPDSMEAKINHLQAFHDEMASRIKKFTHRIAWVKICRVMAAFYPRYFSTITSCRVPCD